MAATVMMPAPFVIVIPDPAVSAARVKPVPFPMFSWPFVGVEVKPVPPFAIASVPVTPVVNGSPVRFVATPEVGVPRSGAMKVLFVNVSVPAKVANVPEVGSVIVVAAVLVNVVAKAPEVVRFPPNVIVLPVFATPVPPFDEGNISVTLVVKSILPASMAFVTLLAPIDVTPVFESVTSPVTATLAARFEAEPTRIFPLLRLEPTGLTPVMAVDDAEVTRPLLSIVMAGTVVAEPYVPAATPVLANVLAKLPVPDPVTSPVKVIV